MATSPSAPSAQHTTSTSSPALRGVLTWDSPAQRNRLLDAWRQAVMRAFAEQPRCLRLAWALDHLFNAKTGFAFASNGHFASKTGLTPRNVQKALATLEADGAIVRAVTVHRGAQRWRVVYPGKAILAVGVTSTVDVGGHVHQVDVHNLRRRPRLPKTQMDYARLVAEARERCTADALTSEPSPVAAEEGRPSNGVRLDIDAPPPSERRH
jgi:hypothetical protein